MRCFVKALFAPMVLLLALSMGLLVPTTASASHGQGAEPAKSRWTTRVWDEEGTRTPRVRLAKAYYSDSDAYDTDDEDARPRRRYQSEHRAHRRHYTQRRHTRQARHHRHRRHIARHRGSNRRVAHHHRATRHAATPTWTKRSLSTTGPVGSGQHGIASYYWEPQRVAAGGWFNPDALTAAHRSLPFGTRVRVTHLASGRSVEVKINDRGPYVAGRIIDLSRAAAAVIGMTQQGIARVAVEVLGR